MNAKNRAKKSQEKPRTSMRAVALALLAQDPSGELLGTLLVSLGLAADIEPSREWEKYIPLAPLC